MRATVSESRFRAVWAYYDGVATHIARHLHIDKDRVHEQARALGLQKAGYLTASEAARLLGLSPAWVAKLCRRGDIPCIQGLGEKRPQYRITRQAVEDFRPLIPTLGIRPFLVDPGYVTSEALARRLGYTPKGVQRLCKDGTIQATKNARGDLRIPESEAERVAIEVRERGFVRHRPKPVQPKVKELIVYPKDLPGLLRFFVERSGRSSYQIALDADVTPSGLSRILSGARRGTTRESIDAIAGALRLTDVDHGRLLVAAGMCPRPFLVLGYDESIEAVAATLAALPEAEAAAYRSEVIGLAKRYRKAVHR